MLRSIERFLFPKPIRERPNFHSATNMSSPNSFDAATNSHHASESCKSIFMDGWKACLVWFGTIRKVAHCQISDFYVLDTVTTNNTSRFTVTRATRSARFFAKRSKSEITKTRNDERPYNNTTITITESSTVQKPCRRNPRRKRRRRKRRRMTGHTSTGWL